jgi:DNA polymerase III gamma/tau subunit
MEDNTSPVDDMPDVSLVTNDIAPAPDATPSETPAEQAVQEGADTQEQPKEAEVNTAEGEQPPAEQQQEQQPQDDEAAIRARNEAFARQRIAERQRTRQAVEQQINQAYAPKTEEDLVNEGYDPAQAQIEALRQEMYYHQQKSQIAEMNAGLQSEAVNIANDFPIFRQFLPGTERTDPQTGYVTGTPNPEYDPEFTKMVQESYAQAARLQVDENNIILNAEVPLYDYYQRMATIYNRGTSRGQQQGQQEYQQMLSRSENPGGSSSTTNDNSLEALEERLGDMVIT